VHKAALESWRLRQLRTPAIRGRRTASPACA